MSYYRHNRYQTGIARQESYQGHQTYARPHQNVTFSPQYITPEPMKTNSRTTQRVLIMPQEIATRPCNTYLFGNLDQPFGSEQNLNTHSRNSQYSSPFSSLYSDLDKESMPSNLEIKSIPSWNFAILPKDRTNYSSSCSSCAESQSSTEYDS